jgi:hypothetical protein
LEVTKIIIKKCKSDSRAFLGPTAGKSAYFMHPDFSAAKLEKKSAQIMRVNMVVRNIKNWMQDEDHVNDGVRSVGGEDLRSVYLLAF